VRIGLIVDGLSEADTLEVLIRRSDPSHVVATVKAGCHPEEKVSEIARDAAKRCRGLLAKRIELFVVVLDLETRNECPGELAASVRHEIARQLGRQPARVRVVVKVTKFENWLVADPACFREMPALFPETDCIKRAVRGGRADNVNALALLNRACGPRRTYDKRRGAAAICAHLDPGRAAQNSRSFRRFLRVLEDERYLHQSKQPNPDG